MWSPSNSHIMKQRNQSQLSSFLELSRLEFLTFPLLFLRCQCCPDLSLCVCSIHTSVTGRGGSTWGHYLLSCRLSPGSRARPPPGCYLLSGRCRQQEGLSVWIILVLIIALHCAHPQNLIFPWNAVAQWSLTDDKGRMVCFWIWLCPCRFAGCCQKGPQCEQVVPLVLLWLEMVNHCHHHFWGSPAHFYVNILGL